jgi:Zn-dependent M28 family amino/carboxypeptidase
VECHTALEQHVRILAQEIGPRNTVAAASYIENTFTELGYQVRSQSFEAQGERVRNLDAELLGHTRPKEVILVGAHYDTVAGCPGANDNGSAVAALLELARLLADEPLARSVRFVAFVNEEPPYFETELMGSRVYAAEAARRQAQIVAMLSLETMGYYTSEPGSQRYPFPFNLFYPSRGDFISFVGNLASRQLVRRCVELFREHTQFPYGRRGRARLDSGRFLV